MKIVWYIERLRVMGFREALHRVHEQGTLTWLKITQAGRTTSTFEPQDFQFCRAVEPQLPELEWDLKGIRSFKEALLDGYWPALGYSWRWQKNNDWHMAPDSGKHWPIRFFGAIPYRQGNPFGDIRVAWEPSRLQQLLSLALVAREEAGRGEAVTLFEKQLLSWVEANPPYIGIHYVSAMECGLRLVAVCHAADIIRSYLVRPGAIWSALISLVESHAHFVVRRLSRYSSAGNHTLAETAGLIYAGFLFPELKEAKRWRKAGVELFEKEAARQFYTDGGGIEQAFGYHLFITDLTELVARLLSSKNQPSFVLPKIVERARLFLGELFDEDFKLPSVGDNDGGFALGPYLLISRNLALPRKGVKTFPDSGYSLIREPSALGRLILFDHGPLGMAPSFGHGHSDCLSVFWREKGDALLSDVGTFTYTGEPRWRHYFRGVSAHNTVSINGEDQSRQKSAFMWAESFKAVVIKLPETIDGFFVLLAGHGGYERLGVRHYRAVVSQSGGATLVWDRLISVRASGDAIDASLWWHCGGQVSWDAELPNMFQVTGPHGSSLKLEIIGGDVQIHFGDAERPAGWCSPIYGKKLPTYSVEASYNGNLPWEFYTYIMPEAVVLNDQLRVALDRVIMRLRGLVR